MLTDPITIRLAGVLFGALLVVTAMAHLLGRAPRNNPAREGIIALILARVRMWWAMCLVLVLASLVGPTGSVVVFGLTSFLLLREFITITPTRRGDHRVLFWVFFVALPLQYYFLGTGWYGMFIITIPVYAFLFIPIRAAVAGDAGRFLERTAKIQWGLMICVYCVAHAPALLRLDVPGHPGAGLRLLVFLTIAVQVTDLVQRIAGSIGGSRRPAGSADSPRRFRPLAAGLVSAATMGLLLSWAVPFSTLQSVEMAILAALAGSGGTLCLEMIQRDRGRKGVVVAQTRPGMIERVIPTCFAAPIFFHLTRFFFLGRPPAGF